jgi:hypothetical protein
VASTGSGHSTHLIVQSSVIDKPVQDPLTVDRPGAGTGVFGRLFSVITQIQQVAGLCQSQTEDDVVKHSHSKAKCMNKNNNLLMSVFEKNSAGAIKSEIYIFYI